MREGNAAPAAMKEGVRMAKDLPELKALIVDIEKVQ